SSSRRPDSMPAESERTFPVTVGHRYVRGSSCGRTGPRARCLRCQAKGTLRETAVSSIRRRDGIEAMDENPKIHSNGAGAVDRAGRDLLSLSMMPMRQSLRFYAELQRTALETFSRRGFRRTPPLTAPGR